MPLVVGKAETLNIAHVLDKICAHVGHRIKPESIEDWLNAARRLNIVIDTPSSLESVLLGIVKSLGESYSLESEPQLSPPLDDKGKPTRAVLKRIYRGLSKQQYSFILGQVEHDVSSEYTDVEGDSYGYNLQVTSCKAFNDSGVGTNVVFYRTSKSQELVKKVFYASAIVESIEAFPDGRYRAIFRDYALFDTPIASSDVEIDGWNVQNAMEEIDSLTLFNLLTYGFQSNELISPPESLAVEHIAPAKVSSIKSANKLPNSPYSEPVIPRDTWEQIPTNWAELSAVAEVTMPEVTLRDDNLVDAISKFTIPTNYGSKDANKFAEKRAIHVVKTYFDLCGWTLKRDRQLDGCGYDLEYVKAGQELHVEVKGIKGDVIAFNLTELEWQRVLDDECFIVAAVTGVLKAESETLRFLDRAKLAGAQRKILQYRISMEL